MVESRRRCAMPVNCFRDARGGVSEWQQAWPKQQSVVAENARHFPDSS
jgi:hypothetical protein